ncbi:uncharacterized protein BDW47DRAFT_101126 [Aspergillus candidus]|uniref:Uncharacterized protein n=1 Tax=Aspergillus candidus TaxID=41067 RepID=A0A2I2FII8_ASPCN|nr:hypothetical protein BDW47DRAFT_101126 [Aspergillus candidus]PLB40447.1 hypothetical protein BDW47DRAFT_101126 [Aspergillus candidus]
MTRVGKNIKVKRKRLNPRAAFCPGKKRRAMRSREAVIMEDPCSVAFSFFVYFVRLSVSERTWKVSEKVSIEY